jgi:hypothetical protein
VNEHHRQPGPERPEEAPDRAHAPGKRRLGPPPSVARSRQGMVAARTHDQPWVPTSGLVGRTRRSARRG